MKVRFTLSLQLMILSLLAVTACRQDQEDANSGKRGPALGPAVTLDIAGLFDRTRPIEYVYCPWPGVVRNIILQPSEQRYQKLFDLLGSANARSNDGVMDFDKFMPRGYDYFQPDTGTSVLRQRDGAKTIQISVRSGDLIVHANDEARLTCYGIGPRDALWNFLKSLRPPETKLDVAGLFDRTQPIEFVYCPTPGIVRSLILQPSEGRYKELFGLIDSAKARSIDREEESNEYLKWGIDYFQPDTDRSVRSVLRQRDGARTVQIAVGDLIIHADDEGRLTLYRIEPTGVFRRFLKSLGSPETNVSGTESTRPS